MIDVIIPVYNDSKNLKYCLASIAMQTIKDIITVHVVDDYSAIECNGIINEFTQELNIKYYRLDKNVGAGAARQYGIEQSNNPYICFIDSDDVLYNPKSMEILYNCINEKAQYAAGITYDERYDIYTCDTNDIHGKMYSRKFLMDNNIKFNNTRIHDSCYFNNLVLICSPVQSLSSEKVYFYSDNKLSTSSIGREEYFRQLWQYFYNIREILNFADKNKCKSDAVQKYIENKKEYVTLIYKQAKEHEKKQLDEWLKEYKLSRLFS